MVVIISGVSIFFESLYYYLYGANVGPSTLYFILQTNENETFEFLQNNIDVVMIGFTFCYFVSFYSSLKMIPKLIEYLSSIKLRSDKIFIYGYGIFSVVLLSYIYYFDIINYNLPYLASRSIIEHYKFTDDFEDLGFKNKNGHFKKTTHNNQTTNQETYVIVIGESTTKNRMQLYGYAKETSPNLSEIQDDLFIFDDVISPHVGTILSLGKVLTTNDAEQNSKKNIQNLGELLEGKGYKKLNTKVGSIVQLFNLAGFKTFWLSNQRPMGIHENLVTEISKAADTSEFINIANFDEVTPYDHELLPIYEKALKDPANKKVIFLHLLGTHMHYEYRYPIDFDYFKTENITLLEKFISKKQHNKYMGIKYDNAIRYNDYLLREVIEKVKNTNSSSYVLFFSDHGEELNPPKNNPVGHYFEERTASMYEIPFVVWLSPKFRENKNISYCLTNKFMTDNLIHAISDLSSISYEGLDLSKSIFSKHFKERSRIIMQNKDFDNYFYSSQFRNSLTKK
ncbi:sulfatase-like hydrolase/transferase [Aquimarina sp. RZ0]|uniref:sulfatase-like hydrolase/transferase n=1 Tax=Aquimarina sp. RZ0 TaxID=2607730 RepID=UPI00165F9B87|nr:sulfatase-like hydrolase/transferase [Aquimarina sp. RZ0]